MISTDRKKVYKSINDSKFLSENEKDEMFGMFLHVGDSELEGVAELFQNNPAIMKFLYENMKKKEEALKDGNLSAFNEIFKEEMDLLNNYNIK